LELISGTEEAIDLINELQKDGSLINFYSKEVFDRPNIQELFDHETLDELIKKNGNKFLNHLLVGCFHSSNLNNLINLFTPCKEYFDHCYLHQYYDTRPCFAIINIKTKAVCLMSIGNQKGHYYEDYFSAVTKKEELAKKDFEKHDYSGIVNCLRKSLETIANVMNKNSYYEHELTDEDWDDYKFEEEYLQNIFPNFELICIEETSEPF
jgi:hypothetical protein